MTGVIRRDSSVAGHSVQRHTRSHVFAQRRSVDQFLERWWNPNTMHDTIRQRTHRGRRSRVRGSAYLLVFLNLASIWQRQGIGGLVGCPGGMKRSAEATLDAERADKRSCATVDNMCFLTAARDCAMVLCGDVAEMGAVGRSIKKGILATARHYAGVDPGWMQGRPRDACIALDLLLTAASYRPAWRWKDSTVAGERYLPIMVSNMTDKELNALTQDIVFTSGLHSDRVSPSQPRSIGFRIVHDPGPSVGFQLPRTEFSVREGDERERFALRCMVLYTDHLKNGGHYHFWERSEEGWTTSGMSPRLFSEIPADMAVVAIYDILMSTADDVECQLMAWQMNSRYGPFIPSLGSSWKRSDRWLRAKALDLSPPMHIWNMLRTWPELDLEPGQRADLPPGRRATETSPVVHRTSRRDSDVAIGAHPPAAIQQSVSGAPLMPARLASVGRLPALPRSYFRREGMREHHVGEGSGFEVAADRNATGSKLFYRFKSPQSFFQISARLPVRNFYEIIPPDTACCFYLDLEHYTPRPTDDDFLEQTLRIVREAFLRHWPDIPPICLRPAPVLTASRQLPSSFKHSFHVVFPQLGFRKNHGRMREFAKDLAELPGLQALGRSGEPHSLLDPGVYNRNQNFRLVESWKFSDSPTSDMVLRFLDQRPGDLDSLLGTVVTNTSRVTFWCEEPAPLAAAMDEPLSLLHRGMIDGLQFTGFALRDMFTRTCPCSGLYNNAPQTTTSYHFSEQKDVWMLTCGHPSCRQCDRQSLTLGSAVGQLAQRYRCPQDVNPCQDWSSCFPAGGNSGGVDDGALSGQEICQLVKLIIQQRLGMLAGADVDAIYLSPDQALRWWAEVASGSAPHACANGWGHLLGFTHICALVQDEVDRQWILVRVDMSRGLVLLETALGRPRPDIALKLRQWLGYFSAREPDEWRFNRLRYDLCSSTESAATLLAAGLFESSLHARHTGDVVFQISSLFRRWLEDPQWDVGSALRKGSQSRASVEWIEVENTPIRRVAPPPAKAARRQIRLTTINLSRPTLPDQNKAIPVSVTPACLLEPTFGFRIPCRQMSNTSGSISTWAINPQFKARDTRVISQNLGPHGLWRSLRTVRYLINNFSPTVILLQDCLVDDRTRECTKEKLRQEFPQFQNFVKCDNEGGSYPCSLITLVHECCGKALGLSASEGSKARGRLLSVRVTAQPRDIVFTNGYNYQATDFRQDDFFHALRARIQDCQRLKDTHIVGADFNASLLSDHRIGYAPRSPVENADRRFMTFVHDPTLQPTWAEGRVREGVWTWRSKGRAQAARLDEILISNLPGQEYSLRTFDNGNVQLDHRVLMAEIPGLLPQPCHRPKAGYTEVVDHKTWGEQTTVWRAEVEADGERVSWRGDAFEKLQTWANIGFARLPKRRIQQGGPLRTRIPHLTKEQRKLAGNIRRCERAELQEYTGSQQTQIMHQIAAWRHPGIPRVPLPPATVSPADFKTWQDSMRDILKHMRGRMREISGKQRKDLLQRCQEQARSRMERPGEKEIKRLLGRCAPRVVVPLRSSKLRHKRHPDLITGRMSLQRWSGWLSSVFGTEFDKCLQHVWNSASGEPLLFQDASRSVEVTRSSLTEIKIRVSPMHLLTTLMERLPSLELTEFVQLGVSVEQKLRHKTDTLCHEEAFFGINAVDDRAYCGNCRNVEGKAGMFIMSKITPAGVREVRYTCRHCHAVRKTLPRLPLPQCPIPDDVLTDSGFDPSVPVLTKDLTWEDFLYWLSQLPTRSSAGDDGITYEMWRCAPVAMQRALYEAVSMALTTGQVPDKWQNALVTLLGKRPGEEHILESTRPICLMATAAKMVTGIWAHRLSRASEARGVFEEIQEGFRPGRSTKRQAVRLLSCLQSLRHGGGRVFVAFLDFENYFNTISLQALFYILRQSQLCEKDVQALERYYQAAYMQIRQEDGSSSAKINLGRGLRQGCPLSPVLGGLVVNAMVRGLARVGGGIRHDSGVRLNTLAFADDTAFVTESLGNMQLLFDRVHEFCSWAGVHINLAKSEVTGYDYGGCRALSTNSLTIGGGHLKHILPSTPFKYLGIRITVTLDLQAERAYVLQETKRVAALLKGHEYHPSQIDWLVRAAIISIFRYSAALADWDDDGLESVNKLWACAYKYAWKVSRSFASILFEAPSQHGGMGIMDSKAVVAEEVVSLLRQCTSQDDDLHDIIKADMCRAVLHIGSSSLGEAQKALTSIPDGMYHLPRSSLWSSDLCLRFITHIAPSALVDWDRILEDPTDGPNCGTLCALLQPLSSPGVMSLVNDEPEPVDAPELHMVQLRLGLLEVARLGMHRRDCLLGADQVLTVPRAWESSMGLAARQHLESIADTHGWALQWEGRAGRRTLLSTPTRAGQRGADLVGGEVLRRVGARAFWGTVIAFHDGAEEYDIEFQDGSTKRWSIQQVCKGWQSRSGSASWTQEDQIALGQQVRRIVSESTGEVTQRFRSPFPSRLDGDAWSRTRTWFTCQMRWMLPDSIRAYMGRTGLAVDTQLAQDMCHLGVVFWAPPGVWNWASTSSSNRHGWMVRTISHRVENGRVFVTIRSLHQYDSHREGDIAVSGPVSIRSIAMQHSSRHNLLATLSAAELGDVAEGGFQACEAFLSRKLPGGTGTELKRTTYVPIGRRQRAVELPILPVSFTDDMRAMRITRSVWPANGGKMQVVVTGGQAFCQPMPTAPHLAPAEHGLRKSIRGQAPSKKKRPRPCCIEEPRWALLRMWFAEEEVVDAWKREWNSLSAWEATGGRTLHWRVTSTLRNLFQLDSWVGGFRLAADPSFESHQTDATGKHCVLLNELPGLSVDVAVARFMSDRVSSVIVVPGSSVDARSRRILRGAGKQLCVLEKGDRVCLRKGWWQTGERHTIQTPTVLEIWSNLPLSGDMNLHDLLFDGPEVWLPDRMDASLPLQTYLSSMPGHDYLSQGYTLVATDGSLRLRRGSDLGPTMGAGVAWDSGGTAMDVIGGPFSSTRAELAGICMGLTPLASSTPVALLVDSSAAIQRLRRFRSTDFQLALNKVKDFDVIEPILECLRQRQNAGATTVVIKVHGHSSDPLHTHADILAVQGANKELEDDEQPLFPAPRSDPMSFRWTSQKGGAENQVWGKAVKQQIRRRLGEARWSRRKRGFCEAFLARPNSARHLLGQAVQQMWDWSLRHWLLSLIPSQYPVNANKSRWNKGKTPPSCSCGAALETFTHLQLVCPMTARARCRQAAHNRVAKIIEEGMESTLEKYQASVWDRQLDTFLSRVHGGELGIFLAGSGASPNDILRWQKQFRTASPRDQPSLPLRVGSKRNLDDLLAGLPDRIRRQRADGLVINAGQQFIAVVEIARTLDDEEVLRSRRLRKHEKYSELGRLLQTVFPTFQVLHVHFVIGVQGSLDEGLWRDQLSQLQVPVKNHDSILRKCILASIEGSHQVYRAGALGSA